MPVKLRLARRGRKKQAMYDIVAADSRSPRDGKFIEKIGLYNPNSNPAFIDISTDKAVQWLINGAQPTDTVKRILSYKGVLLKKHLQVGVLKGSITQEVADAKYTAWVESKTGKVEGKSQSLADKKASDAKAKLVAEGKVNEARAEAIRLKNIVAEPVLEEAATEEEVIAETEEVASPEAITEVVVEPVAVAEVVAPDPVPDVVIPPTAVAVEEEVKKEVASPEAIVEVAPEAAAPSAETAAE